MSNKLIQISIIIFHIILFFNPTFLFANSGDKKQSDIIQGFTSKTLQLHWSSEYPEPVQWNALSTANNGLPKWISLLVHSKDEKPFTNHLGLHGRINGRVIPDKGKWLNANNYDDQEYIEYERSIHNNKLALAQSYRKVEEPYHLKFEINLKNKSTMRYVPLPEDRLELILGPGLGDQSFEGLGYANSLYSFVEAVASTEIGMRRYRAHTSDFISLPWAEEGIQWLGLQGRYYAILIAPVAKSFDTRLNSSLNQVKIRLGKKSLDDISNIHLPEISINLPLRPINIGENIKWEFIVFSGPKTLSALRNGQTKFEQLIFSNLWFWMRWLCFFLLWLLTSIHELFPDWGISIILLAVIVRLAMYPIAKKVMLKQKEFVAVQKRIKGKLLIIKRSYSGEEQSERILELYKKNGVSPLSGLVPLIITLLQLPVLIALFHVLGYAYELHDAQWLWIKTLAEPDKLFNFGCSIPFLGEYFNLLPVIMALSTLASLKLSPAPAVSSSAKRLQNIFLIAMAIGFFILFYPFPSGMVLYWTIANILHICQHKLF